MSEEAKAEHGAFYLRCALGFHKWNVWSKPFDKSTRTVDDDGVTLAEGTYPHVARRCVLCGITQAKRWFIQE